jgi:hypothetical protein
LGPMTGGFVVAAHWAPWRTTLLVAAPLSLAAIALLAGLALGMPARAAANKG